MDSINVKPKEDLSISPKRRDKIDNKDFDFYDRNVNERKFDSSVIA